jgi:hypothetical protein
VLDSSGVARPCGGLFVFGDDAVAIRAAHLLAHILAGEPVPTSPEYALNANMLTES